MNSLNKKIFSWTAMVLFAVSPFTMYAQDFAYTTMVLGTILLLAGRIIPLIIGIALVLFIWGLIVFIAKADNEKERESGKQKMIWGVIGLFVMLSTWGLVLLVQELTGTDSETHGLVAPGVPAAP